MTLLFLLFTVRALKEELQLLQEPGSYVGEVIKVRRYGRAPFAGAGSRGVAALKVLQLLSCSKGCMCRQRGI